MFNFSKVQSTLISMDYNWKDKVVLIVEDEEDNYELLCAILEETNVKILKAHNGLEAIQLFNNNFQIDLILMDIKMPEMDGFEATKEIRKTDKNIPIVAQTAYALSGDKERAIKAGCSSYISKPIDSSRLFEIISEYFK